MSDFNIVPIRQEHVDFAVTVLKGRWAIMIDSELFLRLTHDYPFLEHIKAVEGGHGAYVERVTVAARAVVKKAKHTPQ